jgi:dephospho-CoA kinase
MNSNEPEPKPVVGLIGGMGSGKSQVAEAFVRHGGYVISGDRLGHEALEQPDIARRVVRHFGSGVLDENGKISRRRLGDVVFANERERRVLESMVFPWIESRFAQEVAVARKDPKIKLIVFDAAVLLEAGWNRWCDRIVYVHAPRDVRLRRLAQQRGWSAKEVEARENAQMALTDKVTRADDVVDNSGSVVELEQQVADLLDRWGISPAQPPASASLNE